MKLGCFLLRPPSVAEALRRFEVAERLGYDSAWATHVNGQESLTLMAAAAVRTKRIRIGVGVVPIYSRTPATMAQTAVTLWELSGGRTLIGIGLSHAIVVEEWHGQSIDRPAAEMAEYVRVMRAIADQTAPAPAGEKFSSTMPLIQMAPAPEMPILVGALSPAMLRLAGEIADGVVLWLCTPEYVADWVVPQLARGRERAGKTMEGFEIVASIPTGPTDDTAAMRRSYAKQILHNLRLPFYRRMLERGGFEDDVRLIDEVGSYAALGEQISPDVLDAIAGSRVVSAIAAIGDQADIAAKLAEYERAGVTVAGVNPVRIDDFDATLEAAALARQPA